MLKIPSSVSSSKLFTSVAQNTEPEMDENTTYDAGFHR